MKITAVKPAVKTAGRWNVFVDGAYSFSLDETQLLAHPLKIGQEITEAQLAELKEDSVYGKAYARALDLLSRRPRSEKELRDYARRKEWSEGITARVMARLVERGYVNDETFAASWVRSRRAIKPSSARKLTMELRQKGVASAVIEAALSDSEQHDELESLRRIAIKKRARYSDDQKFIGYLARQGFSFDAIKHVLGELQDEAIDN